MKKYFYLVANGTYTALAGFTQTPASYTHTSDLCPVKQPQADTL